MKTIKQKMSDKDRRELREAKLNHSKTIRDISSKNPSGIDRKYFLEKRDEFIQRIISSRIPKFGSLSVKLFVY